MSIVNILCNHVRKTNSTIIRILPQCLFAFLLLNSQIVFAERGREDYDLDDDGLIEINDVGDFKAVTKSWGKSTTLYEETKGCPDNFCNGYELSRDLDFSSESSVNPSLAMQVFEGNGHTLSGVRHSQGVFMEIFSSIIRNLNIESGPKPIRGPYRAGVLTPDMYGGIVLNCRIKASVEGNLEVGGFVGLGDDISFINSHFEGEIIGGGILGGLVGIGHNLRAYASSVKGIMRSRSSQDYGHSGFFGNTWNSEITASYAEITFEYTQPLAFADGAIVEASYYVNPLLAQQNHPNLLVNTVTYKPETEGLDGLSEIQLRCPVAANNSSCAESILYSNWERYVDDMGHPVWHFGSDQELPSISDDLVFSGADSDGDFVIDLLDAFPNNPEASIDRDQDGLPEDCDENCQLNTGLIADTDIELGQRTFKPVPFEESESSTSAPVSSAGSVNNLFLGFLVLFFGVLPILRTRKCLLRKFITDFV